MGPTWSNNKINTRQRLTNPGNKPQSLICKPSPKIDRFGNIWIYNELVKS